MKKIVFVLFCILSGVNGFSQTNWLTFEKENYQIVYPAGWYEETLSAELTGFGMKFMLMSPLEKKNDKFSENVNLAAEEKKAPVTLQQYISGTSSILASMIGKFKLKSSTTKSNALGEYGCIEYTGTLNKIKIQWMQCIWIKGLNIYVVSFAAAQSSYKKYQPLFEKMADSFTIKSN